MRIFIFFILILVTASANDLRMSMTSEFVDFTPTAPALDYELLANPQEPWPLEKVQAYAQKISQREDMIYGYGGTKFNFQLLVQHLNAKEMESWVDSKGLVKIKPELLQEAVVHRWSSENPEACWIRILKMPDGESKNALLLIAVEKWAQKDYKMAHQKVAELPKGSLQQRAFAVMAAVEFLNDPIAKKLNLKNSALSSNKDRLVLSAIPKIYIDKPQALESWIETLDQDSLKQYSYYAWFSLWGIKDAEGAIKWLQKNSKHDFHVDCEKGLLYGWSQSTPQKAADYFSQLDSTQGYERENQYIASSLEKAIGLKALDWAEKLKNETFKSQAISVILSEAYDQEPDQVFKKLQSLEITSNNGMELYSLAQKMALRDRKQLTAWIDKTENFSIKQMLISCLITAWTQDSPTEAFDYLKKMEEGSGRSRALVDFYSNWLSINFKTAISHLSKNLIKEEKRQVLQDLLPSYIAQGSGNMEKLTAALSTPEEKEILQQLIASNRFGMGVVDNIPLENPTSPNSGETQQIENQIMMIAMENPKKAVEKVMQLPPSESKNNALSSAMGSWVQQNSKAAMTFYEGIQEESLKKAALEGIVNTLGYEKPKFTIQWLTKQPESLWESYRLVSLYRSWFEQDEKGAMQDAEKIQNAEIKSQVLSEIYGLVSEKDPKKIIEIANKLPDGEEKWNLQEKIARGWAKTDPQAAIDWMKTLNPMTARNIRVCFDDLLQEWAEKSPEKVLSYVSEFKLSRDYHLKYLAPTFAKYDFSLAMEALSRIQNKDMYQAGLIDFIREFGAENPKKTIEMIEQKIPTGEQRTEALKLLSADWAEKDIKGVISWILSLNNDVEQIVAANAVAEKWAKSDITSLINFYQKIGFKPLTTPILEEIARERCRKDWKQALAWASSMTPPEERRVAEDKIWSSIIEYHQRDFFLGSVLEGLPSNEKIKRINEMIQRVSHDIFDLPAEFVLKQPVEVIDQLQIMPILNSMEHYHKMEFAEQWVDKLPPSKAKVDGQGFLFNQTIQKDYEKGKDIFLKTTDPTLRKKGIFFLAQTANSKGVDECIAILNKLESNDEKLIFIRTISGMFNNRGKNSFHDIIKQNHGMPPTAEQIAKMNAGPTPADFENATKWINAINNTNQKMEAIEMLLGYWMHKNSAEAKVWMESLSITEEQKQLLREKFYSKPISASPHP